MRRLTPMDIYNKEFKQTIRGYDVNEVNEFLDVIISNYEDVLDENKVLKEKLKRLESAGTIDHIPEKKESTVADPVIPERDMSQYDQIIRDILLRIEQIERRIGLYAR